MNEVNIPQEKECKYCKNIMNVNATVCPTCQRNQRLIKDIFYLPNTFTLLSLVISLGLLIFAYMQFEEAKKEREQASAALKQALAAKEQVEKTALDLKRIIKLTVEDSFIHAQSGLLPMGGDPLARKRLETNINKLSKFVEPDSLLNKKWWDNIHKLYPQYNYDEK